jgi:hypothetical protein
MTRTLAVLSLCALAGCATVRSEHVLTGAARPPVAGDVKVVMEGAPAPADCEEIAIVTATGSFPAARLPAVIDALKREAASVGANAVIRVRYDVGASTATATGVAVQMR